MKIPAEALPLYLSESEHKAFAEGNRAEPVDSSARLRGALSQSLTKQEKAFKKDDASAQESARYLENELNRRRNREPLGGEQSRQEERRKTDYPVLLDTRQKPSRRKSTLHSTINIKI